MGTKTITKYVSDMDEQEIAAGQAYQLTIRHPDGSTQQLDISAQNYKRLKLEGLGKLVKKRGRKPGSGTAKAASGTTGTRRRRSRSANAKSAASEFVHVVAERVPGVVAVAGGGAEVASMRGSSSASRPTQFTVRAMRPRAAPSVLLRLDGYVGAASASRTETARSWPTVAARLHMHLQPQRTRRPAFGASDGLEAGASPTRSVPSRRLPKGLFVE
jgi:hypothetical protein